MLDGLRARFRDEIAKARDSVLTVEGETVKASVESGRMSFDNFVEVSDYAVIDDAYRRAARLIGPELARTYAEHLAAAADGGDDDDDALIDARTNVAAMGLVPGIGAMLDAAAEELANNWFNKHRIAIKGLSDKRQDVYREINEMSASPLPIGLARPSVRLQATTILEADGTEKALPMFDRHLLCNDRGLFPAELNNGRARFSRRSWSARVRSPGIATPRGPARTPLGSSTTTAVPKTSFAQTLFSSPRWLTAASPPTSSIPTALILVTPSPSSRDWPTR